MKEKLQKIIPSLWFDRNAEEAARFYATVFKNSGVLNITLAGKAGYETHGIPEGQVLTIEFEVAGFRFIGINGGPIFKINPSISFLVYSQTREEVVSLWEKLAPGGMPLMELGTYPFSEKYGWIQDRYGVNWQLMYTPTPPSGQIVIPTLMFVKENLGKAETAVNFYTSIFKNSRIDHFMRYNRGEEPDREGTIRHAGFTLENQDFAAMDSAHRHEFTFNEAVSLLIECQTQAEIDYYWSKLTSDGGQESVCGWLKDKFGVSWQVAPSILDKMLRDPDKEKVKRVTEAFMKMKKLDIEELKKAFQG